MAFNQLTDEQDELLTVLNEECAEVIQAVCKIQRHGLASAGHTNRADLVKELGDVCGAMNLLISVGLVTREEINTAMQDKIIRLQRAGGQPLLHHYQVPKGKRG